MSLRIAVVIPPLTNLNAPYASAPRLVGFLRSLGHRVDQMDLGLELFLRVFRADSLARLFDAVPHSALVGELQEVHAHRDRYVEIIDLVVAFMQGRDSSIAHSMCREGFLPRGPKFAAATPATRRRAFGPLGENDHARFLALLMFSDLADFFGATLSPGFQLVSYAARLTLSASSFDPLAARLSAPPDPIESLFLEAADELVPSEVDLIAITCPFPGNLLGALRLGQWSGHARPAAKRAIGGGFPSTELRDLDDPRFFDHVDYMVLDDGETPLMQICEQLAGRDAKLHRTFTRVGGAVMRHDAVVDAPAFAQLPAPDYRGIDLSRYVDFVEYLNPAARLWNEGRWLKLTAAHGCYWKRCTFCDISLPYINDYDPMPARTIVDQMDALHEQTGLTSFHFTDEAAPPSLLVNLALELLARRRMYRFWGNIRFDPSFTIDRCRLLATAGMVAVTGGLEVANDGVLERIEKGVTIDQATRVCHAFSSAGILVHAYLMYGFPGETMQDTVDSLEIIRQLFRERVLDSGIVHQFIATAHSPVGLRPELYGIRITGPAHRGFARYAFSHVDPECAPSEHVASALNVALTTFMRGEGIERDVRSWFPGPVPPTRVAPDRISSVLAAQAAPSRFDRVCWLGGKPRWDRGMMTVATDRGSMFAKEVPREIAETLMRCHPENWVGGRPPRLRDVREDALRGFRRHGVVIV